MGKYGSRWQHGYIPENPAAVALKNHKPVTLSRGTMRGLTDTQLMRYYQRPDTGRSGKHVTAALGEMERREQAGKLRASRATARQAAKDAHTVHLEGHFATAENATRGNMVNKAGRAKGIDGRSLIAGSKATRDRYASEELKSYLDRNPLLSAREFSAYQYGNQGSAARSARARTRQRAYGVY